MTSGSFMTSHAVVYLDRRFGTETATAFIPHCIYTGHGSGRDALLLGQRKSRRVGVGDGEAKACFFVYTIYPLKLAG